MDDMGKHIQTTVRYDGPALAEHQMDVQELAPALLALAEMVQLANKKFNGDTASMKVLVKADVEQKCFQMDIHIVQSILESARHLFGTAEYKTAKEIAEVLDLLLSAGVGGGIFYMWKRLWGKGVQSDQRSIAFDTTETDGNVTILNVNGDGANITVSNDAYQLGNDPEMIRLGKKVMKPLEHEGYEKLGFYRDDKPVVEVEKQEAVKFLEYAPSDPIAPADEGDINRTPIRSIVSVKTQRNDGRAMWEVKWASRAEWAAFEDIDWLENFQAGRVPITIPFWLDVTMEMATSKTDPDASPSFSIKKVHGVINHDEGEQGDFLNDNP